MDKINFKNKRKYSQTNKELNKKYQTIGNSSSASIKLKDDSSLPTIEIFNKYKDNIKILIRKHVPQESSQPLLKQVNNIMNRIYDIIIELNSRLSLYENSLLYNESKIRDLHGKLFTELLNKEILQNNVNSLIQKEKDYELIKEKTGIIVNNGKIINTNRKDNEIIILRTENSTLKGVIEQYEIKLLQIEKEFNKKNMNFIKEKNELISKINNLIQEIKGIQSSNYSRYNIAKKKLLNKNNKRSYELSRTLMNESNDLIINNNPSYGNMLKVNDNHHYIDYSNATNFCDIKMNTIAATHLNTNNISRKSSSYNTKIKDKFQKYDIENYFTNKENNKNNNNDLLNNTIINKSFNQNKIIQKRSMNKALANKIYNKIIIKDVSHSKIKDIKDIIKNSDRTKTKSHERHMSKNDNVYMYKNHLNSYFVKNKQIKKIIHKKTSSSKINNIPFSNNNNNQCVDKKENNNSNKENNKNESNLINIKNLILTKGQKNNKNKINLIYRNLISHSLSSHNSINNSRNVNSKYNMAKLYTFNNSKVPTPRSFVNN